VFSVTSYSELAREAREVERRNRLDPLGPPATSRVAARLAGDAPIVAVSDYVRAYPQLIASYVRAPFVALGTDGFGRSDSRAALRSFFEIDRWSIAIAALAALVERGDIKKETVAEAIAKYGVDTTSESPWTR
jgi:pyruvate dehydrogenase E1 component